MNIAETIFYKNVGFDEAADMADEEVAEVLEGNSYAIYIYRFPDGSELEFSLMSQCIGYGELVKVQTQNGIRRGLRDNWDSFRQYFYD